MTKSTDSLRYMWRHVPTNETGSRSFDETVSYHVETENAALKQLAEWNRLYPGMWEYTLIPKDAN